MIFKIDFGKPKYSTWGCYAKHKKLFYPKAKIIIMKEKTQKAKQLVAIFRSRGQMRGNKSKKMFESVQLKYKKYVTAITYSEVDKVWSGKIWNCVDKISFEGKTYREGVGAFVEAVDDYIKTLKRIR